MKDKLETYSPKKRFDERLKSISEPLGKIILLITIIFITIFLTKLTMEINPDYNFNFKLSSNTISESKNPSNMIDILSEDELIKDLPKDTSLKLVLGEDSYHITEEEIKKSNEAGEIEIILPKKYSLEFEFLSICEIISLANKNGDLEFNTELSETSLAWKYRGLIKYKNCITSS